MLKHRSLFLVTSFLFVLNGISMATPANVNERLSLRAVRTLWAAEMTYASTYGNGQFATLPTLGQRSLIDPILATGTKYGYTFTISARAATATLPAEFTVTATPRVYGKTGRRSFLIKSIGDIRGGDKAGAVAAETDPIIADWSTGSIAENELATSYTMEYLRSAEYRYALGDGDGDFGGMSELVATGIIDPRLGTGGLRGYTFEVIPVAGTGKTAPTYRINAVPQIYAGTGIRSFYLDQNGVIRAADHQGGPANENDPPISFWP